MIVYSVKFIYYTTTLKRCLHVTVQQSSKINRRARQATMLILIYPKIIKAGMGVGGHHGEGVLRKNGKSIAYYNTVAGSYGLQMGAQKFGYALFLMTFSEFFRCYFITTNKKSGK